MDLNTDPEALFVQVTLYSYNWSVDLGAALNRDLVRLVKWQNARAHVVHCLLNQKMGLFHHHCFSDAPIHEMESKQVKNQLRRLLLVSTSSAGSALVQLSAAHSPLLHFKFSQIKNCQGLQPPTPPKVRQRTKERKVRLEKTLLL